MEFCGWGTSGVGEAVTPVLPVCEATGDSTAAVAAAAAVAIADGVAAGTAGVADVAEAAPAGCSIGRGSTCKTGCGSVLAEAGVGEALVWARARRPFKNAMNRIRMSWGFI